MELPIWLKVFYCLAGGAGMVLLAICIEKVYLMGKKYRVPRKKVKKPLDSAINQVDNENN